LDTTPEVAIERASMDVDVACVGFGPAMGGFLTTLSRGLMNPDGTPVIESATAPGLPLQVICYERADDLAFGVSGAVTRARAIRETLPDLDPAQIPLATPVTSEKLVYLLDPHGASRRSAALHVADFCLRALGAKSDAFELPVIPKFLDKSDGLILSIGQFNQWVGAQLMSTGAVQIWPGTPVSEALIEDGSVRGIRLLDQGVDRDGNPDASFMPGMDVRAALTVLGDGPAGVVGRDIDRRIGMPEGNEVREWALGMKFVVELRPGAGLTPGTVLHTFGYPEPEIFGFLYAHPGDIVSVGIFVPSSFNCPSRTAYRYLQHFIQHPYLWRYLEGSKLRSWGAKSLQESGKRGEPFLAGNGYARIGESSGSTNVLSGSGVDEAWATGSLLAEATLELLQKKLPFTREILTATYEKRRRESWLEKEAKTAEKSRDGFHHGVITGMIGMALTAFSKGRLSLGNSKAEERVRSFAEFYRGRLTQTQIDEIRTDCERRGLPLHDALMSGAGWPQIQHDGTLMISHQDALLMGGKVQAAGGFADHVSFRDREVCRQCGTKLCIEMCSGQAIARGENNVPAFDREKCVFCGACLWNCTEKVDGSPNLQFRAGAGGFHSTEN
jgi:electron-transferring-flavoprotein dehydrogenase